MSSGKNTSWHFVDGEPHKGTPEDCAKCARIKKRGGLTKRQLSKRNGRRGGKANNRNATRHCACGAVIKSTNKTGKCRKCWNHWRSKQSQSQVSKKSSGEKFCVECGKGVSDQNVSGYCVKCWRKSAAWKKTRDEHSRWLITMRHQKEEVRETEILAPLDKSRLLD